MWKVLLYLHLSAKVHYLCAMEDSNLNNCGILTYGNVLLFQNYRESVPQDHRVDRIVMRISATDIDNGNNSIVVYTLEPRNSADEGYLRIDANSGVIFLNRTLSVRHKVIESHVMIS